MPVRWITRWHRRNRGGVGDSKLPPDYRTKQAEEVRNNVDIRTHAAHSHQNVELNQQEPSCATSTIYISIGWSGGIKKACFFSAWLKKWRSWRAAVCAAQWAFCPAESWPDSRSWRRNSRDGGWQAAPASTRKIWRAILAASTPLSSPTTAENIWCPVSWLQLLAC